MSLLKRVELAQQRVDAPTAGDPVPAPPAPVAPVPVAPVPVAQAGPGGGPRGAAARDPASPPGRGHQRLRLAARRRRPGRRSTPRSRGSSTGSSRAHGFAVTRDERLRLIEEMVDEVTGLGPLEPLLNDETITEVMVNGPNHIYIERAGKIQRVDSHFLNDEHVLRIIDRIITPLGRRIDESSPRVDARLPDGSRVNAIIEPLSLVGPVITVRKFSAKPYTVDDLDPLRHGDAGDVRLPPGLRRGPPQHLRLGRHRLGQDDDPQRALVVHPERRADRHDRGRRRAPAPPGARRHARVAPAEPRGRGRDHDPRPAAQRAAHAPRPDHRRRVPLRRGAGHAPGDDDRPGRLALDRPRQQPARTCSAASRRWS